MKRRQPWWLIIATGLLATIEFGAVLRVLQLPADLVAQVSLLRPLELIANGLWALIFIRTTINLVRRRVPSGALWAYAGFVTYSAGRLLLFTRADYDQSRRPFVVMATLLLLAFLAVKYFRQ